MSVSDIESKQSQASAKVEIEVRRASDTRLIEKGAAD